MADTIVDPPPEPPPPTIREADPPPLAPTVVPPKPKRRGGVVAIAVVAMLTVIAALAAALVYVLFIRYEPRARRHIPANASFAMRMDAADVALFPPVRKHLLAQLEAAPKGGGGPSRVQEIKSATGVDLRTDVRELVVATVDGSKVLVLAGGRIARGRFVSGMEKVFREEKLPGWRRDGALLVGPEGQAIGQADDGTIAFATHRALVEAALPASDRDTLALRDDAAVSFAATSAAWKGLSGMASFLGHGDLLAHVARAEGTLTLGDAPKLSLTAEPASGVAPAALETDLGRVLDELRLVMLLSPDRYGEKTAIASAKVHAAGDHVVLETDWPYAGLERACDDVAKLF